MKKYFSNKGFTLIEMLIVIAIIGILSSISLVALGSARASARDAKRISDIAQIQSALELYYNKNGTYPTGPFATMSAAITGSGLGITSIPNDPLGGSAHYYFSADPTSQSYVLGATLERSNNILNSTNDVDSVAAGWPGDANTAVCVDTALGYCVQR